MIWLVAGLAFSAPIVPTVALVFVLRYLRYLGDQNQMLTAALMATKNTPYAGAAASYVQAAPDTDGGFEEVKVHDDAPPGAKLFGT